MKNTSALKRAVIYTRVSTEEQAKHDLSLPFQRKRCNEYAESHGLIVVKEFEEAGRSGTSAQQRPALIEMLRYSIHEKIDAVIVHKADRLARNMADFWSMQNIWKKHNITLISTTEHFDNTPAGEFTMGIMSAQAQFYSANLSVEVKKGHREKRERGIWPAYAPFGYVNYGEKHERKIKPDEEYRELIVRAFDLFSTGHYSITTLHKELLKLGLKGRKGADISRSVVERMLKNPIYYGEFKWGGELEMGTHEALITKEVFDKVQLILKSRRTKGSRDCTHNFMLRGFLYCSCGRQLTGDKKVKKYKNGNEQEFYYFGCKNPDKSKCNNRDYVQMNTIEQKLEESLQVLKFKKDYKAYVHAMAMDVLQESRSRNSSSTKLANKRVKEIMNKMEQVEDDRFSGSITREDFVRIYARYKKDLTNAQKALTELSDNHQNTVKILDEVLGLVENIYQTYLDASPEMKRKYLTMFVDKVIVENKEVANLILTPLAQKFVEIEQVRLLNEIRAGRDSNPRPIA